MGSMMRTYLDWNATAPLLPAVRDALVSALDLSGNPSSVHKEGRVVRGAIESARRDVAALVGAQASHVVFTSGATEAANLVLSPSFKMGRSALSVSHLYVSAIEHPAIREGGRFDKAAVSEIAVTDDGILDLAALEAALASHDAANGLPMVALMLVNNETGIVQPVAEAARLVHAAGGLLVVDAVQAAGRIAVDIEALGADFLIVSSHKIGGPKGMGALISRGEVMMPKPLIHGGGQEKGHRSGTENTSAIIGFGTAAVEALKNLNAEAARLNGLRAVLEDAMRVAAPDVIIHGADAARVCNTTFFTLPGLKSETGQIAFDIEGIALSAGAACSSGKVGESHVLTAMGHDPKLGALRISLGAATTEVDIDKAIAAFAKIAGRRKLAVQAA
ncbi:cysteine desulfurase family protein [Agrobacterium rubi]|uniref:Cysteine desulfurase n=1 Tax=Agrobacterium rubi TaxID=28099 RepID=A0AAE7UPP0_9HYPH|nr:cysteine desulfurase family protein [Agrobacterium rubi]NTE86699.1 cysteine desulfurase [Agrobacterium rubi]NTF02631.1 cysteine desulfurase [Agrobacterium rubi]NTF36877.1 cysteine desulfurase [Agrobacterium rubi]OCJ55514.1 cysteine desulfurase [Agrobacterium rubi]QTF99320.1 cysteine desulfurase [Agrobacterium rubi]